MAHLGIRRIELQSTSEIPFRVRPVPLLMKPAQRKRAVCQCLCWIELDRLCSGLAHFREGDPRRDESEQAGIIHVVGHARISCGVTGIELHCLVVLSAKVGFMGRGVQGPRESGGDLRARLQSALDTAGNRLGDLRLCGDDLANLAVVDRIPDSRPVLDAHQFCRDMHLRAVSLHAALDDVVDLQIGSDLLD